MPLFMINSMTLTSLLGHLIFGEMSLLGQGMHGAFAQALTPCTLCLMSRDHGDRPRQHVLRLQNSRQSDADAQVAQLWRPAVTP